ncbi:MAG TPA: branched-chain amino acid ABC transporter permease [Crenalkalicoccus sp.]|nr:branched-chain amino acid ABC transporter permease [Crenalkalicoccus sp.]
MSERVAISAASAPAERAALPWRSLLGAAAILGLAVLPLLLVSGYQLFQITLALIYAIAILGVNIVTGYNGQISLGHGAFYAVGAYVTAILMGDLEWSYWPTLPIAAVVCGLLGYGIGFPALRLGGLYLALTTFSLAVAVPQLLKYKAIEDWTGGVQGLLISKPEPPEWLGLSADEFLYVIVALATIVIFLLARNLVQSRIGRALRAIRDQPTAAEAMGMDLAQLKTRAFAVSAMVTGIAGSLSAIAIEFVAPDSFSLTLSVTLFVGMVVGGVASIIGPLFGGLFVVFVPNFAESVSKAAPGVIYGIILIAILFVMPSGVAGLLRRAGSLLARRD